MKKTGMHRNRTSIAKHLANIYKPAIITHVSNVDLRVRKKGEENEKVCKRNAGCIDAA